jgi:outer membrane protein assembly factor BamB
LHIDTSPAVIGSHLYGGSGASRLFNDPETFCLDMETGKAVWRKKMPLPVWGSPIVSEGKLFAGLGNGRMLNNDQPSAEQPAGALMCLSADTGEKCWEFKVPEGVLARPVVDGGHVYFGSRDGCCYCLDSATGSFCWKAGLGNPVVTSPAVSRGRVFALGSEGKIACLDARTGQEFWLFDLGAQTQTRPRLLSSPVVTADDQEHVYFGAELRNPIHSAAALFCLKAP